MDDNLFWFCIWLFVTPVGWIGILFTGIALLMTGGGIGLMFQGLRGKFKI